MKRILLAISFFITSTLSAQHIQLAAGESVSIPEGSLISLDKGYAFPSISRESDIYWLREFSNENPRAILSINLPDGSDYTFTPMTSHTMHPALRKAFPQIFAGKGYDADHGALIYFEHSPSHGFRALIRSGETRWYIDPLSISSTAPRVAYQREDLIADDSWICDVMNTVHVYETTDAPETTQILVDAELNKYRIAVATTGEYTIFHGGTVAGALAGVVTSINRVNSVYEFDVAITLEIVANNSSVIFTDPTTDPYSNNSASQMLSVNTDVINTNVGSSNYDIGHVFATGGGGLAQLNCVCTNTKGRGVTGRASPVGDPFDIDYVAHEIGHQFGAEHTQNNACQRSNQNAYEPFSGSTIMGYAGICAPNLQNRSDDYFHHNSIRAITDFAHRGIGNNCATKVSTQNNAPTITTTLASQYLPILTPFYLSADATDPENDPITFCWEQYDLGPSNPSATIDQGPAYRSFTPTSTGFRYLPRLNNVLTGSTILGERMIFAPRTLNFRVTARDNHAQGGAVSYATVQLTATGTDPFEITSPQQFDVLYSNAVNAISWEVSNTASAPINCSLIDVFLSTNNGQSFDRNLGTVSNSGFALIYIPSGISSDQCRILMRARDGIFYQVTRTFTISSNRIDVEYFDAEKLVLYPNPTSDEVMLSGMTPDFSSVVIDVVSLAGAVVMRKELMIGLEPLRWSVAELAAGSYIVVIRNQQGEVLSTKRLTKK